MSGSFRAGEEKERPGVYRRHINAGGSDVAGAAENVGLAVVSGTWGPLNKPVITEGSDDVASIIGGGKGANVITQMRIGGANTIVVVRVVIGMKLITLKAELFCDSACRPDGVEVDFVNRNDIEQKKVAIVAYGCNKTRLVPLEQLKIIRKVEEGET